MKEDMPDPASAPSILRSLRHRNYRLFFFGQLISLVGTWMQSVAQQWLVYRLTHSPALLGWVGFAGQIPVFFLATFGGVLADRRNRLRIIVGTQSGSMLLAFILAALTLTRSIQIWHIFVLATLLGVVNAVDIPTRQTFVADMVPRDDLPNAIALNSSMVNGARIVGPAVAGLVVASIGEGWCFFANAVSYLAVIAGLLMMNVKYMPVAKTTSAFSHIIEGYRYVAATAPVRVLLVLLGIVSLVAMPYTILMPVFADEILHGGASALGMLMGSSGLGALTGALILAKRQQLRGLGRWVAAATCAFGVSLILFSQSRNFWLSMLFMYPAGLFLMTQMAASNTLIQSMVPDRLRGRVMAVYSMMFMGMAPLGALLAGSLARNLSAPTVVALGGAIAVVVGILFAFRLPSIRPLARQLILDQQVIPQP
jgi:MFS family permease